MLYRNLYRVDNWQHTTSHACVIVTFLVPTLCARTEAKCPSTATEKCWICAKLRPSDDKRKVCRWCQWQPIKTRMRWPANERNTTIGGDVDKPVELRIVSLITFYCKTPRIQLLLRCNSVHSRIHQQHSLVASFAKLIKCLHQ